MTEFPKAAPIIDPEAIERARKYGLTCLLCSGSAWWVSAPLMAHHIVPRSFRRLDIEDNIAMLCPNCHRLVHERVEARYSLIYLLGRARIGRLIELSPEWGGWKEWKK